MSTTVSTGGWDVTSSDESAEDMVAALTPPKDKEGNSETPRVLVKDGEKVEPEPEKEGLSKAAAELGKEGGKAAAAKRKAETKEEKAEPEPAKEPEQKAAAEDDEEEIKKPAIRKRIEQSRREVQEARQEAERERQERRRLAEENERLRQGQTKPETPPARTQPADDATDPKPKVEEYDDYAEFVEARSRWAARQEFSEQYDKRRREAAARYQEQRAVSTIGSYVDRHLERVAGAKKGDPGFKDKYNEFIDGVSPEVQDLKPSFQLGDGERYGRRNDIADALIKVSEHPREVMQHFTASPQDLQRIASLGSRDEVFVAMAKLDARFDGAIAGTRVEPEVSQAPSPVRPVTGAPHAAESLPDENDSYDEHVRKMNARERRASR